MVLQIDDAFIRKWEPQYDLQVTRAKTQAEDEYDTRYARPSGALSSNRQTESCTHFWGLARSCRA